MHSLALLFLEGYVAAAIGIGFRLRSGRVRHVRLILIVATIQAVLTCLLTYAGIGRDYPPLLLVLFDAAMFALATASLTGRRRTERGAERLAAAGLGGLTLLNLVITTATLAAMLGAPIGLHGIDRGWTILLPVIVAGIGLFTIFLLAADLADRTRRLAGIDMQTGLLNRRGLEEAIGAILASMRRNRRSMALALIDIDRFKTVNDRFGHAAGDHLIEAFGRCLRDSVARRDLVARIGGEEFAIVMTDVDVDTAMCAIEVLRERVTQIEPGFGEPFDITASFGLTDLRADDDAFTALVARADEALYRSKADGRNRATLAA